MTTVIAINGSPRKDGNTAILIRHVLAELEREGVDTELVQLAGERIRGCTACTHCIENRDQRCAFDDDIANECIAKMTEADGIILGSPVYFSDVTAEMKALIDRAGFVSMANDGLFKRKGGTAVVVQRRNGATHSLNTLCYFLLSQDVIVPGRQTVGVGRDSGDVGRDEESVAEARHAGTNLAWLLRALDRMR
ncbi:MAG: flavodoxin family protein [Halobacteriota archaeon]